MSHEKFIDFNHPELIVLDLRRDTYEDYSFPLQAVSNDTSTLQFFDLHSLRNYAKYYGE